MNRIILLILSMGFYAGVNGQVAPQPKSFVDSAGRYFQKADQPIYIYASTSPEDAPKQLSTHSSGPIYFEGHGVHTIKHLNHQTQREDVLLVHADGKAPVTKLQAVSSSQYRSKEGYFYSADLSINLNSSDDMSGVDRVFYSLQGMDYAPYQPMSIQEEGRYEYSFYAIDRVGNVEEVQSVKFAVDLTAPSTYHNIIGISDNQVISVNSSIYLEAEDAFSGVSASYYKFDQQEEFLPYRGGRIPFQILPDGRHQLQYYSVDHTGNREATKMVGFYLDKTAPILSADILGDKYIVGDRVYFSGRTKLKLTAVDNKSGIKDLMYSINNQDYQIYQQPFYLPDHSGQHKVKFYALDQTGNKNQSNFEHSVGLIYLDLTGPSVDMSVDGPTFYKGDTLIVGPQSQFKITGKDFESGLKSFGYSLDDSKEELEYTKPLAVESPGAHVLSYFADDHVNNRNTKQVRFITDVQGPDITCNFSNQSIERDTYPSYTTIYLAAVDQQVAMGSIYYSLNGKKKKLYAAPIQGLKKNEDYTLEIEANDHLGNVTIKTVTFSTGSY